MNIQPADNSSPEQQLKSCMSKRILQGAGGLGGLIIYLMQPMNKRGIYKVLSVILSMLIYVFLLAAGFVLGMNGPD